MSKETGIAIFALAGILIHLVVRYALHRSTDVFLISVLVIGGLPLLGDLVRKIFALNFGSDLLAGLSIVVSAILGEYLAGAIVVLMLSGGTALEHYATRRASAVLASLAGRMPHSAHRVVGVQIEDVEIPDVRVGDRLVVFPNEICPVDGVVAEGRGSMDESYLTGEPFHIAKIAGSQVLSGAVNGESAMTITVTRLPVDSRYAKIMQVMQEAEANRPQFRRIGDRLGAWYTVLALVVAATGWIIGRDPDRFLAVLVIATPCPLLLAIPVAIIGAISVAAGRAIIIKDPAMLERIDSCRTVIFDKTGTLTYGRPSLTEVLCAPGIDRAVALQMAASLEQYSKHPLAASILETARQEDIVLRQIGQISEKPGEGLSGRIDSNAIQITGRKNILERRPEIAADLPSLAPGMECILLLNGQFAAALRFLDTPRTESHSFVSHLGPRHRVNRIMLLSGDREAEVRTLGGQVGISEILFGKSPEEKLQIVREESRRGPTLFLGDGINDAPAMQAATVGVAFGHNSDVTAEAADAVVLGSLVGEGRRTDPHRTPHARDCSRERDRRHGIEPGGYVDGGRRAAPPGRGRHRAGDHRHCRGSQCTAGNSTGKRTAGSRNHAIFLKPYWFL
ncbi:MAG TPA: heavy metal translocating P-type ATPase [Bryobacteraceae bacterium]